MLLTVGWDAMTSTAINLYLQAASLGLGVVYNAMLAFEAKGLLRAAGSFATALFLSMVLYRLLT